MSHRLPWPRRLWLRGLSILAALPILSILPILSLMSLPAMAAEPIKVVYHVSDGIEQAGRAIVNIRNHLQADPSSKIVVVTLSNGIDFLLEGAASKNGKPFEPMVAALASSGVEFRVCNNTLQGREIPSSRLMLEAKVIPSGVAEIARLQAREGYVYIRP